MIHGVKSIFAPHVFNRLSLHTSATRMTHMSRLTCRKLGKQLPLLLSCTTYKRRINRTVTACKQATQYPWTLVSSSKLRGIVRTAQEIYLQYINISRIATNLTSSQTAIHAHYAKKIRNLIPHRTTLIISAVMTITTVNMTKTRFIVIAKTQAMSDNYCH